MKITDKLKSKLKSAKSADEVQTILKEVKNLFSQPLFSC